MKTLLKNGLLYLDHGFEKKDLLLQDGIIAQIGESLEDREAIVADLEGKRVAPGFF